MAGRLGQAVKLAFAPLRIYKQGHRVIPMNRHSAAYYGSDAVSTLQGLTHFPVVLNLHFQKISSVPRKLGWKGQVIAEAPRGASVLVLHCWTSGL